MRKWLVVAGVVLVVLVALVAVAALNLDRWLNANRDLLAERAEAALGREVAFEEIGLSFRGGLGVRLTKLRVGDDPAFSEEDFVATEALDVLVRIWPALFGNVEVERVVLREPTIRVTRTAKGLSTDSLGGGAPAEPPADAEPSGSGALLVALVDVRGGTVVYEDRTAKPPAKIEVRALDVNASDIRPDAPVSFEVAAAILGAKDRNFEASGTVGPVSAAVPRLDVVLKIDPLPTEPALALPTVRAALPEGLELAGPLALDAQAEGSADSLSFRATLDAKAAAVKLGESFDKPAGVPLRVVLRGAREGDALTVEQADVKVGEAELRGSAALTSVEKSAGSFSLASGRLPLHTFGAGEKGEEIRDLAVDGTLAGPKIAVHVRSPSGSVRGADYRDLDARLTADGGRVDIEKAALQAWGGALSAAGTYDASRAKPRFDVKTRAEKVRIEQMLAGRSPTLAQLVSGELETDVALRGSGSGWEQIRQVLSGTGRVRISDGVLSQFNAAGDAVRALAALPQFTGSGFARFVSNHPQVFGAADTRFSQIATGIEIREGWMQLPGFLVQASEYELRGRRQGRVSLAGEFALPLDVVMSQALSQDALASARPLRYLRASDGRVEVPMYVQGSPPRPGLDPETVSQLALKVGSGILVDKLLGGGQPTQPAPTPEGAEAPAPPPPPTPEQQAIDTGVQILEGLLGGQKKK